MTTLGLVSSFSFFVEAVFPETPFIIIILVIYILTIVKRFNIIRRNKVTTEMIPNNCLIGRGLDENRLFVYFCENPAQHPMGLYFSDYK